MTITLESRGSAATPEDKEVVLIEQVESCRVGFRTVDILNGMVHVNGKRITVCGMNRHEHDPDHGKVVGLDQMGRDICLLKYVCLSCYVYDRLLASPVLCHSLL
jgi:Glycosyl hydrolases family 2, TIM barrel domain